MDNEAYFHNIRRIEEIISQLDGERLSPEESKELFERGRKLIQECESILDRYSGTFEEMSITPTVD